MRKFAIAAIFAGSLALAGCEQLGLQQSDDEEETAANEEEDDGAGLGSGFGNDNAGNTNAGPVIPKENVQTAQNNNQGNNAALRSWFIGQWTDDGNCASAITMAPDGRFINADGTGGNWVLNGDQLTMSGGGGSITVTLVQAGPDRLQLVYADGRSGFSTRC